MKKILISLAIIIFGSFFITLPNFASAISCPEKCVPSSILGEDYDAAGNKITSSDYKGERIHCKCDDGNGSSIREVLNLIIDILTIGVGILGVVGISVVGVQYLTAGSNEEKARKAKTRILEIVIGLVVYAVFYALLTWLGINYIGS